MSRQDDLDRELQRQLGDATHRGASSAEINSGQLHRAIGGYPGSSHNMPTCCDLMYQEFRAGDVMLSRPPKGKGATLTIRYMLPR